MEGTALWQQNESFSAQDDRAIIAALFTAGVFDPGGGDLEVTERDAGANMTVDVASGRCVVAGTEQSDQRSYLCVFDDSGNIPVTAADGSDTRIDRVVVRVRDSAVSGADDQPVVEVVAGTPGAGEPPSEPGSSITLATITVGANVSSISDGDITDAREVSEPPERTIVIDGDELYERLDVPAASDAGSTVTVDFESTDKLVTATNSGAVTVAWSGVPSDTVARSATLRFTAADSVTWPAGTRFSDGVPVDVEGETWVVAVAVDGDVTVFLSAVDVGVE